MAEVSDEQLLGSWRAGDRTAGDLLVQRYFDPICRFFRSKLGDDVEDLIQRTFLDCAERRDQIQLGLFRAYLFAVARNRLFDHLRSVMARPIAIDLSEVSLADLGTSPSQRVAKNERQKMLMLALARLPLDQQIVLELAYWEGLSGPEIAHVIGVEPNTVRSRLARAREALRSELEHATASPRDTHETLEEFERGGCRS